jgi:uncharacterized protein
MTAATAVPIAAGLFTWPSGEARLLGGRCPACGVVTFPVSSGCPRCGHAEMEVQPLARTGTVWTWTTQGFRPKHPYRAPGTEEDFRPFILGYVELADGVRVESQLLVGPEDVHIGMAVELLIVPFCRGEAGEEIVTFAFGPVS